MKFPDNIEDFCLAAVAVGSRVTCSPPPMDTDQDILCLVDKDELDILEDYLSDKGWEFEGEDYAGTKKGDFMSWRGEHDGTEYNLIITTEEKWFDSFMDATFSCKEKNLMTKAERVAEFDKFMPKVHVKSKVQGVMEQMHAQLAMQKAQQDLWNQAAPGAPDYTLKINELQKLYTQKVYYTQATATAAKALPAGWIIQDEVQW